MFALMCYSIPGKILSIERGIVALDYFGETRKARNEFIDVARGDYVYAQGGFVIQKIASQEAESVLEAWRELFFKLKAIDTRLAAKKGSLYQRANAIRQEHHGNACCVHGIIEFSNHCTNDCAYCGIRNANTRLERYRMTQEEIVEVASHAVHTLGFKALVLQSGDDEYYDASRLSRVIKEIQRVAPCLITISVGERNAAFYQRLYDEGARGVLLRFETGDEKAYASLKKGSSLATRLALLKELRAMGYLVATGFLCGLPGQTKEGLARDIEITGSLEPEVFSIGPFIPHPDTPLASSARVSVEDVLTVIAQARIRYPQAKILVTTALETLDPAQALRLGLLSGANSLMMNVTPYRYKKLYELYPHRYGVTQSIEDRIRDVVALLQSIGRAPTDLGV